MHVGEQTYTRQLEALNEVAQIATLDLELHPMMQRITDALADKFGWEFVALIFPDPQRTSFTCGAVTSSVPTEIVPGYSRPLGSGIVGKVAATGAPIVLDDVTTDADYVETAEGIRSEICVPVKHGESLVAILNLESRERGEFHGQLHLLQTIAKQIAGAIASARLIAELRERARLMQMMSDISRTALQADNLQELLSSVVQFLKQRFPVDLVAILMHDPASATFRQMAAASEKPITAADTHPLTVGITGRCIRTASVQYVHDVTRDPDYLVIDDQVLAELAIPILFRNEILGVLNIEAQVPDVFTPANVLAFESFADQIAGAIHLASVKEQLATKGRAVEEANLHLSRAIETLHRLSSTDPLTDVANRRHFDETLESEWRRALRSETPVSLLMVDIDEFKAFNDCYGHQAGDDCLRRVARLLQSRLQRAGDLVARYGGEEFAVLLPGIALERAAELAEATRVAIQALQIGHCTANAGVVTISVGVASAVPTRDFSAALLLRAADEALYDAKRSGRNRVSEQAATMIRPA